MTNEEFITKIKESREAYIQSSVDFMDALERLDFETAAKHSMSAPEILGMDVMEKLMRWCMENDTEEIETKYDEITNELNGRFEDLGD